MQVRKVIIKLPTERVNKFRLQLTGTKGRRFLRASSILNALSYYKFREKTAITVKEYIDGSYENINQTLASTDKNYLLFAAACFLEDFLSDDVMNNVIKRYAPKP